MEALAIRPDGIYLDGTFGRGGHARAILARLGPTGRLLGLDRDPDAMAVARALADQDPRLDGRAGPLRRVSGSGEAPWFAGVIDGLLLDIGVSSPQLDDPGRGFSFARRWPAGHAHGQQCGETAAQWLARAKEAEIAAGPPRLWRRAFRSPHRPGPGRSPGPGPHPDHPAPGEPGGRPPPRPASRASTRPPGPSRPSASRSTANSDELRLCLAGVCDLLALGGRLAVISFHSLEDRIVKRFIRGEARGQQFPRGVPVTGRETQPGLRPIGKAVHAPPAEVAANPRARSAVMRVAERLT